MVLLANLLTAAQRSAFFNQSLDWYWQN